MTCLEFLHLTLVCARKEKRNEMKHLRSLSDWQNQQVFSNEPFMCIEGADTSTVYRSPPRRKCSRVSRTKNRTGDRKYRNMWSALMTVFI